MNCFVKKVVDKKVKWGLCFPQKLKKDRLFGFENKSVSYGVFYNDKIIVCCKQEQNGYELDRRG